MVDSQYLRNNIEYRITSSRALSDYKNCQAFMLAELVCGTHKFSSVARDIALLYYDNWFKFCTDAEQYVLRYHTSKDEYLRRTLEVGARNYIIEIYAVMSRHTDIFPNNFLVTFKKATHPLTVILEKRLARTTEAKEKGVCYKQVIDVIVDFLNTVMYVLHELDSLMCLAGHGCDDVACETDLYKKPVKPFLCVTYFSMYRYSESKDFLDLERLRLYIETFGNLDVTNLCIKCYVPTSVIGTEVDYCTPSGHMLAELSENIKENTPVKTICFE